MPSGSVKALQMGSKLQALQQAHYAMQCIKLCDRSACGLIPQSTLLSVDTPARVWHTNIFYCTYSGFRQIIIMHNSFNTYIMQ